MALKRMDNVGIVVDDLAATIQFIRELGLELEGQTTIRRRIGPAVSLGSAISGRGSMIDEADGHAVFELSRREVVQYKDAYRRCYIRGPEGFSSD